MSKPIKLTDELRQQAIAEFSKTLASTKMSDGKISYNKNFTYGEEDKATILFTPIAYTKMVSLIMNFDSEIAWHGVGRRIEGAKFLISDILVYPQTVSGTDVQMDTEAYAKWIQANDEDERFNHIIMQGHSHVLMSTSPSSTDLMHQENILSMLSDDMYYIFLIWNKKLEHTTKIYDLQNNTLYENKDITYGIADENVDLDKFVDGAREQVKKRTYAATTTAPAQSGNYSGYGGGYGYSGYSGGYNGGYAKSDTKNKKKNKQHGQSDIGSGWSGRGIYDMDDYADDIYPQGRFDT